MTESSFQHYSFKIWFRSIDKARVFPVAEAAWGRLKRAFREKRGGFFICATRDGQTFALNLARIQLVQFVCRPSAVEAPMNGERSPEVTLYYGEKKPESFLVGDPIDLAKIFSALKPSQGGETLSFTNSEGDEIAFFTEHLTMLESSTIFVEEGYAKLYQLKSVK